MQWWDPPVSRGNSLEVYKEISSVIADSAHRLNPHIKENKFPGPAEKITTYEEMMKLTFVHFCNIISYWQLKNMFEQDYFLTLTEKHLYWIQQDHQLIYGVGFLSHLI